MVIISMGRLPLRMGVLTESESVTARKVEEVPEAVEIRVAQFAGCRVLRFPGRSLPCPPELGLMWVGLLQARTRSPFGRCFSLGLRCEGAR
jgi:hypothetical protein